MTIMDAVTRELDSVVDYPDVRTLSTLVSILTEGAPYTYTESANKRETDDVVNEINELEKSVI